MTHESARLQNQIQVTDAPFLPKFAQAISETLCEPLPPSTKLPDNLLYDLAIISVLDLRGRKKKKSKGREHGMWACQCIGLGVPAEPWDAEISLSGLY